MRVATLEVHLTVIDNGEPRQRWNGGPMASRVATDTLLRAVEMLQRDVSAHGFAIAHTGYGVTAEELPDE